MRRNPASLSVRPASPTLKTIADRTGLAVTTVSKALRTGENLNAETVARVHAVAREVGYRPDRAGVKLRTGKTFAIAVVIDQAEEISDFARRIVVGISSVLRDTPYEIAMTPLFPDHDELDLLRSLAMTHAADGVIFTHTKPEDARIRLLTELDFPFVTHGRSRLPTPHAYYDFDNEAFTELAAGRLIEKGRRNLALISPSHDLTFFSHAVEGLTRAARRNDVTAGIIDIRPDGETYVEAVRTAARRAAREGRLADGVICSNDIVSLAFIDGVMSEGVEIGRDLDIIARRTSSLLDFTRPRIECVREDLVVAGQTLADLMLKRLQGVPAENLQVIGEPRPSWLAD